MAHVGETKTKTHMRLKEHLRNIRLYYIDESALVTHCCDNENTIHN